MNKILSFVSITTVNAAAVSQSLKYFHNGTSLEGYLAYDDAIKGKPIIHQGARAGLEICADFFRGNLFN